MIKHFLSLIDLQPNEILSLIDRSIELKRMLRDERMSPQIMNNRTAALVMEQTSTRTRVSFEVAAHQLGGQALFLAPGDSQLNRGESIADTARTRSAMVDVIVIRTLSHAVIEDYAKYSTVPVVNGLSELCHPCQLLADLQTVQETKQTIQGLVVSWIGDGNNMCQSWACAAAMLGFEFRICTPEGFAPRPDFLRKLGIRNSEYYSDPREAAKSADVIVTDTWLSMGKEDERQQRIEAFGAFQVSESVMSQAAADAIFLHCLPAYRGMEVEKSVIDGPQSFVWQEAENRLHAQKALLEWLLS